MTTCMSISAMIDRRTLLQGAGALAAAGGALAASQANSAPRVAIDFSNELESVRAYAKLAGTLEDGMVHYWYKGIVYGATHDETHAMVGWTGLLKMVWRNLGNGSFHFRNYDMSYFTEPGSDTRIEEFENPFTGRTNYPIDVIGGPFDIVVTPKQYPWTRSGDDIWVTEPQHFRFMNKLDPDEWPLASTGEMLNLLYLDGFRGKVSDLENPDLVSAPSHLTVNHVNPWYPFFLMGKLPGVNYWHGQGKKISDLSDISPAVLEYVESRNPDFMQSDAPWETRTDSYAAYRTKRQPVKE